MRASFVALLAILLLACTPSGGGTTTGPTEPLTVFAAASLRDVMAPLAAAWRSEHSDVELITSFDGSNRLATQIGQGAPADVFLAADLERTQRLADDDLAAGEPVLFARNRIALAVPAVDGAVATVDDLATAGARIVAAGAGVPISRYAKRTLEAIAATMPDPVAFVVAAEANVVSREDNVRAALTKVELGEGDAAFVYTTDVLSSAEARSVPLPAGTSVNAEYSAVAISDRPAAEAFVAWLGAETASKVLATAGFELVAA